MAIHPGIEVSLGDPHTAQVEPLEVVESVRPRLADVASGPQVDEMIREALEELTPARVTTFLPILVERRVRERLRRQSQPSAV